MWLVLLLSIVSNAYSFSLIVTGDVNLNPNLPAKHLTNFSYVWGDMFPILKGADFLAINHESTLAGIKEDNPDVRPITSHADYIGHSV